MLTNLLGRFIKAEIIGGNMHNIDVSLSANHLSDTKLFIGFHTISYIEDHEELVDITELKCFLQSSSSFLH